MVAELYENECVECGCRSFGSNIRLRKCSVVLCDSCHTQRLARDTNKRITTIQARDSLPRKVAEDVWVVSQILG